MGYASTTRAGAYELGAGQSILVAVDTPVGTDLELTIIPAPGGMLEVEGEWWTQGPFQLPGPYTPVPAGYLRHWYSVHNVDNNTTFRLRYRVYNTDIAPAALKKAAKQVKVKVYTKAPKVLRTQR